MISKKYIAIYRNTDNTLITSRVLYNSREEAEISGEIRNLYTLVDICEVTLGLPDETSTLPEIWDDLECLDCNLSPSIHQRWYEIDYLLRGLNYGSQSYQQHIRYMQLILLRDIYRQGWKPDWMDRNQDRYSIVVLENEACVSGLNTSRILSFQTAEIRDLFLKNFKGLIEECKDFI